MSASANIKSIIDNGWYTQNNKVGLPYGTNMYDYPTSDNLFYLIMKIISLFTSDWALTLNIFFILTFPLSALTATFVFRKFNIDPLLSIVGGTLFSLAPYHFFRGVFHIFLSAYFVIPLSILVVIWIFNDYYFDNEKSKLLKQINKRKIVVSLLICMLIAVSGMYYAFFSCFFILFASIIKLFEDKKIRSLVISAIFISTIVFIIIACNLTSLMYQMKNGSNPLVANRSFIESEIYGLKIIQLILPRLGHRVGIFSALAQKYIEQAPLVNENLMASLGVYGAIGFLFLLLLLFIKNEKMTVLLTRLSYLNIASVLLGSIGAFGSVFAIVISPKIRGFNRISIFILFFSLFAILIILSTIKERYKSKKYCSLIFGICCIFILFTGVYDQTSPTDIPDYEGIKSAFESDRKFVKSIEASVPENSKIFQLPYVPFPENPPVYRMADYDLFKGYLHSNSLSWSYGAIKGRESDLWQINITSKPIDEFIENLSLAGFEGIYIDRFGYEDNGQDIEMQIENILGSRPLVSDDKRLVFYTIGDYNKSLLNKKTSQEQSKEREEVLFPVLESWSGGFSGLETSEELTWRWCSGTGELFFNNTSNDNRKIIVSMELYTGYEEFSNITLEGCINLSEKINYNGIRIEEEIILNPGINKVEFTCDAKHVYAPQDPRDLVFRVANFEYQIID